MKSKKSTLSEIVLQPFILNILGALKTGPQKFSDFKKYVKNDRTLSLKLSKLQDYGIIEVTHKKVDGRYTNLYVISIKGKNLLKVLEKVA